MIVSSIKGCGLLKRSISLYIFIHILFPSYLFSEETPHIGDVLKKIEEERLYEDNYWRVLLHYKPERSGFESLIDDPSFFLSPYGKTDPKAELKATVREVFQSDKKDDEHPKCRFVARYEWLRDKLNIDEATFAAVNCKEYNNMINNIIHPKSLVLVFPASYMNNPASMFGHTLLRIDGLYQSKLLSYAANYAALAEDEPGFFYVFKGLFGHYKGYFKVFPYYERVAEYNDIEQRDMWEYSLNFSEDEVKRMFMHLWELKDIYSYYYFFYENCSYNLLFLLEAARPSLQLTDNIKPWVIPVDTIRIVKDSGVTENIEFRPAKATKIRHIASLLEENHQKLALKIANQALEPENIHSDETYTNLRSKEDYENPPVSPFSKGGLQYPPFSKGGQEGFEYKSPGDTDKIKILDLATETVQYKYNNRELTQDAYSKLFLAILRERSKLGAPEESSYNTQIPTPPEDGHLSNRLSLGLGIQDDILFQEIQLRPAYHSLTDPDQGYVEGSQIVFADTTLRYYNDGRIRLESFDMIDISSFSPRSNFFQPLSWKIKTGFSRKTYHDEKHLIYQVNPGFGLTYKNRVAGLWYILGQVNVNVGGEFKDSYAAGAGLHIGTVKKITDYWKINLSAESLFYGIREWFHENRAAAVQSFRLNQNNSINLSISWEEIFKNEQTEVKLNWNYYF